MKIVIANDHRGYKVKQKLVKYLEKKHHEVVDLGTDSDFPVDYPTIAFELGETVTRGDADLGIILCATGIGVSIACNKVSGVRCAKPATVKEARLSRFHNDANVLALSAMMPYFKILDIVDAFLNTNFSQVERHQKRIDLITNYELKSKRKRKIKNEESSDEC